MADTLQVRTPVLEIACEQSGPADGPPVVLLHGFPYSPRGYDEVVPPLVAAGHRVLVPFLRGYGDTRFLSAVTPRSGQQGAIGCDLLALLDALGVEQATLAGYDWGGRAACVVAALWPQRVRGLVSCCGYQIQDIAASVQPADPQAELRFWYQYYLHTPRGRAGLARNRDAFCRLLWSLWSPTWKFDDATFALSAGAFANADFVDVVVHSYRHRFGYVEGDPHYDAVEAALAKRPTIGVPAISVHGLDDGVNPPTRDDTGARLFTGRYERRLFEGVGHNPPQEAPQRFAQAVLDVARG